LVLNFLLLLKDGSSALVHHFVHQVNEVALLVSLLVLLGELLDDLVDELAEGLSLRLSVIAAFVKQLQELA